MVLIDAFLFNDELDLLDIRLNHLAGIVDRFVLVEAPWVIQDGRPKPLTFLENRDRFAGFADRITHIVVDDLPSNNDGPWERETHQRNAVSRGLVGIPLDTPVLLSDVDEIPTWPGIVYLVENAGRLQRSFSFEQIFSYYFLNCRSATRWYGTQACTAELLLKYSPQDIRGSRQMGPRWVNGGWHFSTLAGQEGIGALRRKLTQTPHSGLNRPEHYTDEHLLACLQSGVDLWNRPEECFRLEPLGTNLPPYVLENQDRFSHLIGPVPEYLDLLGHSWGELFRWLKPEEEAQALEPSAWQFG